jgi:uncharacterized paraquat-inducible protein A
VTPGRAPGIYVPRSFWKTLLDPEYQPTTERVPSVIELRACPHCKEWLTESSRDRCAACGHWLRVK